MIEIKITWEDVHKNKPQLEEHVIIKHKWIANGNAVQKCRARAAIWTDRVTGEPMFCDESLMYSFPDSRYWIPLPEEPSEEE